MIAGVVAQTQSCWRSWWSIYALVADRCVAISDNKAYTTPVFAISKLLFQSSSDFSGRNIRQSLYLSESGISRLYSPALCSGFPIEEPRYVGSWLNTSALMLDDKFGHDQAAESERRCEDLTPAGGAELSGDEIHEWHNLAMALVEKGIPKHGRIISTPRFYVLIWDCDTVQYLRTKRHLLKAEIWSNVDNRSTGNSCSLVL
ncbi:hypothetical protein M426DRAFT_259524 [Hypoxylon sp. CI-4A]|nr:hypothetical protein M426DRAFT_259524 [Hypoxylon sp. CI-4A]